MELVIRTIGLVVVFFIFAWALWRGKDWPAIIFVFLAPLSYFSRTIGIGLTPAKMMGLMLLIFVILNPKYLKGLTNKYLGGFKYYFLYMIGITIVMVFFWPDYSATNQGFLYSNAMRGYVQIFQVGMGVAVILMFLNTVTSVVSLFKMQVTILYSMIFICVYGLYIWFAQRVGLPFNPIARPGSTIGSRESVVINTMIDGQRVVRAYSLSGEPKTMAVNACWGLILTYFTSAKQSGFFKGFRGEILLVPLFLISLYLTLSTAGYLILPMVIFASLIIMLWVGQLRSGLIMRFVALLVIMVPVSYFADVDVGSKVKNMYETRIEQRLAGDDGTMFTYAEAAIVKFWEDQPAMAISGVGLGGSAFYVREYDTKSYAGYIAAPRGIVGFISDKGLIGLFLFLYGVAKASGPMIHAALSRSRNKVVYSGILIFGGLSMVAICTTGQWQLEWVFIGLFCAGATVAERELNARPQTRQLLKTPA